MKAKIELTDDVKKVLDRATIEGVSLKLNGELERKLYEHVNKVLVAAGGKWNTKAKAHLFPSDPREILGLAIERGTITNEVLAKQKELQQYFTPPALAKRVVGIAEIQPHHRVMEPSCGSGNLLMEIIPLLANPEQVRGVEIDRDLAHATSSRCDRVTIKVADFLSIAPQPKDMVDRIVMNPPFSNKQDMLHVTHALQFLKPGGRLVAIMGQSWTFLEARVAEEFREMVEDHLHTWVELDKNAFKEAGVGVATGILSVDLSE